MVLNNRHPASVRITECLDIYETFHHMERKATWGAVPWPCSCTASHADCVCKHGALLTAVFDPTIKVPPTEFVACLPFARNVTASRAQPERNASACWLRCKRTRSRKLQSFSSCIWRQAVVLQTGRGTSLSASAQHQGGQETGGQETVVVSGATDSQAPRAGLSASPQRIAASSDYGQWVPGRLHFWRKKLPVSS
jgi:hypothetical protein